MGVGATGWSRRRVLAVACGLGLGGLAIGMASGCTVSREGGMDPDPDPTAVPAALRGLIASGVSYRFTVGYGGEDYFRPRLDGAFRQGGGVLLGIRSDGASAADPTMVNVLSVPAGRYLWVDHRLGAGADQWYTVPLALMPPVLGQIVGSTDPSGAAGLLRHCRDVRVGALTAGGGVPGGPVAGQSEPETFRQVSGGVDFDAAATAMPASRLLPLFTATSSRASPLPPEQLYSDPGYWIEVQIDAKDRPTKLVYGPNISPTWPWRAVLINGYGAVATELVTPDPHVCRPITRDVLARVTKALAIPTG